jgi:hypothetical protein
MHSPFLWRKQVLNYATKRLFKYRICCFIVERKEEQQFERISRGTGINEKRNET